MNIEKLDDVTASDLLDMTPEAVHAMVAGGQVSMEAFCEWFDSQTGDSQADGYASGWQDGQAEGYDQGYEDGNSDSEGDELEIDDTTSRVK
jgi:flagellar biosynthesis/type III secretory pathway protein FliH